MSGIRVSWPVVMVGGVVVLAGAAAAYLLVSRTPVPSASNQDVTPMPSAPAASSAHADVVINLSAEAAKRAGITVTPVTVSRATNTIRVAAVVEPDAYRQVVVTPLVSGRVVRVLVALGDEVRRGTPVVEVYSPELAEAQTEYLSMRAEFQAVEQQIERTQRLVEIGAASKQELEQIHAGHVRHRTEVETSRAQLQLLGMTPAQVQALTSSGEIAATTTITAPVAGTVTARTVNPGSTVDPAAPLITIVDLSSVWIAGDLYERDFASVRIGTPVSVTTAAFPDVKVSGNVSYIDPQVRPETRTAKIRVSVGNTDRRLKLGMFANIDIEVTGGAAQLSVPRSAVQNIGERTVVYLRDRSLHGSYVEREIRLGASSGDQSVVVSGLSENDQVVTSGSFFLRAEGERMGPHTH